MFLKECSELFVVEVVLSAMSFQVANNSLRSRADRPVCVFRSWTG